jgi:hypothetical protein
VARLWKHAHPRDLHGLTHDEVSEVIVGGRWAHCDVDLLLEVHRLFEATPVQVTYATDPWGKPLLAKLLWARWPAPSSGRMTTWHLPSDSAPGRTACGVESSQRLDWQLSVRYGAPPGACGICTHESRKRPVGDPDWRRHAQRMDGIAKLAVVMRVLGESAYHARLKAEAYLKTMRPGVEVPPMPTVWSPIPARPETRRFRVPPTLLTVGELRASIGHLSEMRSEFHKDIGRIMDEAGFPPE